MNRFNIEVRLKCTIKRHHLDLLFSFLKPFGFNQTDIQANPQGLKLLSHYLTDHEHPEVRYDHTPLLKHLLIKNIHQTTQVFLPILFCRRNYFKQHKSWGYPIIHFMDEQPEIYPISTADTQFHRVLGYPEDIAAIIVLREAEAGTKAKNIIRQLNRESGLLEFNIARPFNGSVVILRKMYLYYDHGLRYHVNIHDEFLLKHHIKKIYEFINPAQFRGAWIDADTFFMQDTFLSYTPEISRNYNRLSDERLLHDWARFLVQFHHKEVTRNARLTQMYKSYLNGILLPKMNYIHTECGLKSSANNPFLSENLHAGKTVYTVDDSAFIYHRPYYFDIQVSLKRLKSFMTFHDIKPLTAGFGDFLNIKFSFREKAVFSLLLKLWGVDRFESLLTMDPENLAFMERILQEDSVVGRDLKLFQDMQNHLHRFVEKTEPLSKVLVLFPDEDEDWSHLFRLVEALEQTTVEYDVISLNHFLQVRPELSGDGSFRVDGQHYAMLVLPGIRHLPMKALVKINDLHQAGGKLITMGRLPENPDRDQELYKAIHNTLWLDREMDRALYFKKSPNNGFSYFISDGQALAHILHSNTAGQYLKWETLPAGLKYFERRLGKKRFLLFLNLSAREQEFPGFQLTQTCTIKLLHATQEAALKFINAFRLEKGAQKLPFKIPEFSFILCEVLADNEKHRVRSHIQPVESNDWYVEIDGQEQLSRLGDRSVEAPYNWKPVTYSKVVEIDGKQLEGNRVFLKLGTVYDWCTIRINDKKDIHCFSPPFEVDITPWVKAGTNGLTISIGHRLSNHMAVAAQQEHTIVPVTPYGLIGPVEIAYRAIGSMN